ncbi:aldehyde dehydrogenase family protein [Microbacteriaceae bacterium MWH-Ta3]|nr:aldehyde dehydrogenase family protein [Microbacteriaceae bacterium MWH-Ta3]
MSHMSIPKTYKLFIGGKFPRSESGRVYDVHGPKGVFLANVAQASRKDARDAVVAARSAQSGWAGATAYNRGQVLYRIAEMLDGRTEQFVAEIRSVTGASDKVARAEVHAAVDMWVWYAGWADKYAQIAGNANPVSGPFFNLSVPEPTGVVVSVASQDTAYSLIGLVSAIAPAIVTGNTVVVIANEAAPLAALSFAEVVSTSDVPGGVINILTGSAAEIMPWLASHADVNALDLAAASGLSTVEWEKAAADTLTRIVRPRAAFTSLSVDRIDALVETKTIWHTKSLA